MIACIIDDCFHAPFIDAAAARLLELDVEQVIKGNGGRCGIWRTEYSDKSFVDVLVGSRVDKNES